MGMPAGKVDEDEDVLDALVREVEEEIGLKTKHENYKYFEGYYVRYPDYDLFFHIYHLPIKEKPTIILRSNEHKDYRWLKPKDALNLNLIQDEDACIKYFFKIN
jgi:8-oxo-dGTP pyrophosphatase MutT (NUDIX family)